MERAIRRARAGTTLESAAPAKAPASPPVIGAHYLCRNERRQAKQRRLAERSRSC